MFSAPDRDQVIALAGLFQSAALVYQLAHQDSWDDSALLVSAVSILKLDTDSVSEIFGGTGGVSLGGRTVAQAFSGKLQSATKDVFTYGVAMHQLAIKLDSMTNMSHQIQQSAVALQNKYGDALDELDSMSMESEAELFEDLAGLYAKTISTMTPRIMVNGSKDRLSNLNVVYRVRTALFAGIRAAHLWHQLGGRRWHLMLHKKSYQTMAGRFR